MTSTGDRDLAHASVVVHRSPERVVRRAEATPRAAPHRLTPLVVIVTLTVSLFWLSYQVTAAWP
jgi:hypothetical protein